MTIKHLKHFGKLQVFILIFMASFVCQAQTAFTYQGQLHDQGSAANGINDFEFTLYPGAIGGVSLAGTITLDDITVEDGFFTATLDFGSVFDGSGTWLEISVRPGAETGAFTLLSPRQPVTPAPLSLVAGQVEWLDIVGVPQDIGDGDDDTLDSLACAEDEIAQRVGGVWQCVSNDANAVLAKVVSVDGTGSGLDADTVDGTDASAFAIAAATASSIADLQVQIDNLSVSSGPPSIIGVTSVNVNGGYSFGGRTGTAAITHRCKNDFPSVPTAHMCTSSDIHRAISEGNFSGIVNNQAYWFSDVMFDGFSATSSINNDCHGMLYPTGHIARGQNITFFLNYTPNGGATGNTYNVTFNQACGTGRRAVCCS